MKILLVTEDVPVNPLGGAAKHAVLLGNALIDAGHKVEMLGRQHSTDLETNIGFSGKLHTGIDLSKTGLKSVAMGIFNPVRQLFVAWRIWKAIKLLDYKTFDVIHYHGHITELGVLVPRHVNYVHTLHDQGSECMTMLRFRNGAPCTSKYPIDCAGCATNQPNIIQKAVSATAVVLHRYIAQKAFKRHKAIFVSDFVLRRFKEVVGNTRDLHATVIHNFTDARSMQSLLKFTSPIKPKNSRPIVLIAGRVDATKGQAAFLEALPDSLLEKIEVRIAGDGPDLVTLKAAHEERGVIFLGWLPQEDVYKETIKADACVVPSIWEEPCGTTSLEALALGKMVFALARGGSPEQMRYCSYPNQLRLFSDMTSLAKAVSLTEFAVAPNEVSLKTDVTERLPEILNVYSKVLTPR